MLLNFLAVALLALSGGSGPPAANLADRRDGAPGARVLWTFDTGG